MPAGVPCPFRPEDKGLLNYGRFVSFYMKDPPELLLDAALRVIAKGFTKSKQISSDFVLVIVGIDEINRLHDWDKKCVKAPHT